MKIVFITVMAPYGLREVFLSNELSAIKMHGEDFIIVTKNRYNDVVHKSHSALLKNILHTPVPGLKSFLTSASFFCKNFKKFFEISKDIIFNSGNVRKIFINIAILPKVFSIANILKHDKPLHIHAYWGSSVATLACGVSRLIDVPWSFTVHRWDITDDNMLKKKAESASFIRVISQKGIKDVEKIIGSENKKKIKLIHLGVEVPDIKLEDIAKRFNSWNNARKIFHIAYPAWLENNKGHIYLINALCKLKRSSRLSFKCTFYGEGTCKKYLQTEVKKLYLEKDIIFHGSIPNEELIKLYRYLEIDIVALFSFQEGIPIVLIEAMANIIPVVATAVGGVGELLSGDAGLLVDGHDPALLADAIEKIAKDRQYAEKLAFNGYEKVKKDFSSEINSKLFIQAIKNT